MHILQMLGNPPVFPGTPGFFHHGLGPDLQSAAQKPLWGVNRPP